MLRTGERKLPYLSFCLPAEIKQNKNLKISQLPKIYKYKDFFFNQTDLSNRARTNVYSAKLSLL